MTFFEKVHHDLIKKLMHDDMKDYAIYSYVLDEMNGNVMLTHCFLRGRFGMFTRGELNQVLNSRKANKNKKKGTKLKEAV